MHHVSLFSWDSGMQVIWGNENMGQHELGLVDRALYSIASYTKKLLALEVALIVVISINISIAFLCLIVLAAIGSHVR